MPSNAGSLALETEADGRRYAIALLEAFEKEVIEAERRGFAVYAATTEGEVEPGVINIYRDRPQTDTLERWVSELYARGTPAANHGFFTVATDYLGSGIAGALGEAALYGEQEQAGEFDSSGGMKFRLPEQAQLALAKGEKFYRLG